MKFDRGTMSKIMREGAKLAGEKTEKAKISPEYAAVSAEDDKNFPHYLKGRVKA